MIKWNVLGKDCKPTDGSWVLVTYRIDDFWRTRIYQWFEESNNRKITHWSEITPPDISPVNLKRSKEV